MRPAHPALPIISAIVLLSTVARADPAPRLIASWTEKDARVVAFSPDGRSLVSSGGEGYRLRDTGTGRVRAVLAAERDGFEGALFSPDGRLLFARVGSNRHAPVRVFDLKVWVVASGEERATFPYLSDHSNGATDYFALSRDGKTLAFLDNAERLPMQVKTSKFTMDGRYDLEIHYNASPGLPRVKLWDVTAWKERATLDGGSQMVFSPDGTTLVTGPRDWHDPTAKLWDTRTGRLLGEFDTRGPWVKPLTFSPDGKYLAIGDAERAVLRELSTGRTWPLPAGKNFAHAPVFSPDGRLLLPGGVRHMSTHAERRDGYDCYDLSNLPPRRLELERGELAIAPDASRYAAVLGERGKGTPLTVVLRDLPSLRECGRLDVTGLAGAEFSPDGRWLALLAWWHEAAPPDRPPRHGVEIRLVDPATARVALTVPSPGPTWGNYGCKFSPDGKTLAVYYRTGSNVHEPGEPDPFDRPMSLGLWEIPAR